MSTTQAYRRRASRQARFIERLVARIRREHDRRTPEEAVAATETALRRWRLQGRPLRILEDVA